MEFREVVQTTGACRFYRPDPLRSDGLFHTVTLRVKGRKDLVVRVRKGYYAPKL